MNWDDAKLFVTIARCGSVRRAAAPLDLHHSTVSRRLEALERQLGVRLFERGRRYALTPAGEALRAHAEAAERALAAAEAALREGDARIAGRVSIAAPAPLAEGPLCAALPGWLARFPDLAVELIPWPEVDPSEPAAGAPPAAADLIVRVALAARADIRGRRICAAADAVYAADSLADPAAAAVVGPPAADADARPAWCEAAGWGAAPIRCRASAIAARAAAVAAGLGVAALPCWVGDLAPGLRRVSAPWPAGELRVEHAAELSSVARVQAALRFCVDALRPLCDAVEGRGPRPVREAAALARGDAQAKRR